MKSIVVAVAGLTSAVGLAKAQSGTLDQVSPFVAVGGQTSNFNVDAPFLIWDAQVRAGIAGQLEGVNVQLDLTVGATGTIRLRSGSVDALGPVLAEAELIHLVPGVELQFVDFTAANLQLNPGDTFVLEFQGHGNGLWVRGTYRPPPALPYYPEPLYLNGGQHADGNWRIGFETFMLEDEGCPADLTASSDPNHFGYGVPNGVVDADDFFYFLDMFSGGSLSVADLSGSTDPNDPNYGVPDGILDASDFFYYLDLFVQGCP